MADHHVSHTDEIKRSAYAFWETRGRPLGSPEKDWFQAKEQLEHRAAQTHPLTRCGIKRVSVLGLIEKVFLKGLLLALAFVLVIFVGVQILVWTLRWHMLFFHEVLAGLPWLAARLGKLLLIVLLISCAIAFVKAVCVGMVGGQRITMRGFLDGLPTSTALLGKALLLVFLIMSATGFARVVGAWMVGGDTITIVPFTDTRSATSQEKSVGLGPTITEALISQIHRINQLHTLRNPWGSAEETPALEMAGPQAYERVGTVSFMGIELPVGELILALRALWPSWHTRYVISGSLQNPLSGRGTRGQLTVRLEEDGRSRKHWSYPLELNDKDNLSYQIEELAYEVMWSTLAEVETNSLKGFKNLIQGIESFRHYKDTKATKDFDNAKNFLKTAIDADKKYARAYLYLGNLYNWRASYEDHDSLCECDKGSKCMGNQMDRSLAIESYKAAGQGYTYNPHEAEAFEKFGKGLVHFLHYKKAKEQFLSIRDHQGSDSLVTCLNEHLSRANHNYTHVPEQDRELYFTKMAIALVHKERAWLSKEVYKDRIQEEISTYCAISEFRHAKYIAEDRKDRNNLRWLNSNLQELDRQLREGKRSWWSWPDLPAVSGWILAVRGDCSEFEGMSDGNPLQYPMAYQGIR
jgi:hypothetical protein